MYSYEQRISAAKLYVKYGYRAAAVIRELGYPNRHMLVNWFKEYKETGDLRKAPKKHSKYTEEQKQTALGYYLEHGGGITFTVNSLGYPSKTIFKEWLNEAYPERKKHCVSGGAIVEYPQEKKEQTVIDFCSRAGLAEEIAEVHGIARGTLYSWKDQLLGKGFTPTMPKRTRKTDENADVTEAEINNLRGQKETLEQEMHRLQQENYRLQLQNVVLKKAGEIIKKKRASVLQY